MYFADFSCMTAIGAGTKMTMAGIEAGISGYLQSDYFCANDRSAIIALIEDGLFASIQMDTNCTESLSEKAIRSGAMVALAADDLNQRFPLDKSYPLIWLNNEPGIHEPPLPLDFLQEILTESKVPVDVNNICSFNMGRASGIYALRQAYKLLHEQGHDFVLIGAADSPYSPNWLAWLDKRGRLKHEGSKDAFAPGEGSGFLLLARTPELAQLHPYEGSIRHNGAIALTLPGLAQSPSHWYNNTPHKGEALSQAMLEVVDEHQSPQSPPFDAIVSSQNGELFWVKEHRVALSRLPTHIGQAEHYHPFECTGDLGALTGIFLLGYAAHLLMTGVHQSAMVYAMSDNEWRAATGMFLEQN